MIGKRIPDETFLILAVLLTLSACQAPPASYRGMGEQKSDDQSGKTKPDTDDILDNDSADKGEDSTDDQGDEEPNNDKEKSQDEVPNPDPKPRVPVIGLKELPSYDMARCTAASPNDELGPYLIKNPGSTKYKVETDHFVARWNDADGVTVNEAKIREGLDAMEKARTFYITKVGFTPHYKGRSPKYKISVNLSDKGYATGSGTGEYDPEMWVNQVALDHGGTLGHELAHTFQFSTLGLRNSKYVGWTWESHANFMAYQAFNEDTNCGEGVLNSPQLHYGTSKNRYCNWLFWEFLKDQSCYQTVNDIWDKGQKPDAPDHINENPLKILARNQKWSVDQLNSVFANWALHNATLDYKNGAQFLEKFGAMDSTDQGPRHRRITRLQKIQDKVYAVPSFWAPQAWGYNLVKLYPTQGASSITFTFKGIVQTKAANTGFGDYENHPEAIPNPNSDWRWGVVALDAAGKRRYSPIIGGAKGEQTFDLKAGDKSVWLVVMGSPTEIQPLVWDQAYYTTYRYPWMMKIDGAMPEGLQPSPPNPSAKGKRHPNGGGWVDDKARVDSTVFVGPNAMVLGGSVTGKARIEDYAVVKLGNVSGDAVVGELAVIWHDQAFVKDNAVLKNNIEILGPFTMSGTAQLLADGLLSTSISKGIFYGTISADAAINPKFGANRTEPSKEVTAPAVYVWP